MIRLDQTHWQRLRHYQPQGRSQESLMKASVAMIFREGDRGTEVLLMQRAFHPKDPWSGQMSFPGGKIDPCDDSAKAAAIRETLEEVGASLRNDDYIGRLDDVYGMQVKGVFTVHVSCFVFKAERKLSLVANDEVADMAWVSLAFLNDPANAHNFVHPSAPGLAMPAVMIDHNKSQILWGLTLRILSNLHTVLGLPMGVLTDDERQLLDDSEKRQVSSEVVDKIENALSQKQRAVN